MRSAKLDTIMLSLNIEVRDARYQEARDLRMRRQREVNFLREAYNANRQVGLVYSGMDCDCVRYVHPHKVRLIGETFAEALVQLYKEIDRDYEYSDGPMSHYFCDLDKLPGYSSEDLALRAFEDGHSHVVYA